MFSTFSKSIVWQIILPVPAFLIVAVLALWYAIPLFTSENAKQDAIVAAQGTVNQFKTIRAYYTKNVIKKALENKALKPHFDHKGKSGVIPLPATFIHDLSQELQSSDTKVNLYSAFPFPNRKDRSLDPFQNEAWGFLKNNPDAVFSRQEVKGDTTVVRVAIADKLVAQGCVNCHNTYPGSPKTDWKLNEVRGVLEVSKPITAQLAAGTALSNKIMAMVVIAGILLIAISVVTARRVSRPLASLNKVVRSLASGDDAVEVPETDSKNEIGEMARGVLVFKDNMIENKALAAQQEEEQKIRSDRTLRLDTLNTAFDTQVGTMLQEVETAVGQLETTASSMSSVAEQTNGQASAVGAASEEASANVQTVSAATEELSASVGEISRQVAQSADVSKRAVEEAKRTNSTIQGLATAGQKIGEVVDLITDIASQTNLLALNATIEAARAGEAGKGFAVVASEVKSLATQTAKATEDIADQISEMQAATQNSVEAIDGIGKTIEEVSNIASGIAAAVEEQGAATQEISRNVLQASEGTQDVSRNINGVTEGAEETGQAANQVTEAVKQLTAQSNSLKAAVEKYLVDVRAA